MKLRLPVSLLLLARGKQELKDNPLLTIFRQAEKQETLNVTIREERLTAHTVSKPCGIIPLIETGS